MSVMSLILGLITLMVIIVSSALLIVYREKLVLEKRWEIAKIISQASFNDIVVGRKWKWRYDIYDSISHSEMLFKFWKPIDSFYDEKVLGSPQEEK